MKSTSITKVVVGVRRAHVRGLAFALGAVLLSSGVTSAHTGATETSGLAAGFMHPLLGLDHLLAMVAVGLWAAQMGGRKVWVLPGAFVVAMIAGGALGMAGVEVPFVEQGILASVLVLGALIAVATRPPIGVGVAAVALFAVFHGHAHGAEVPVAVGAAGYTAGFAAATAMLHAAGIGIGAALKSLSLGRLARYAGGAIAALGVYLALGI